MFVERSKEMKEFLEDASRILKNSNIEEVAEQIMADISENYDIDDIYHDLRIKQECEEIDFIPGLYIEFCGLWSKLSSEMMEKFYPYIKHDLIQAHFEKITPEFLEKHPELARKYAERLEYKEKCKLSA